MCELMCGAETKSESRNGFNQAEQVPGLDEFTVREGCVEQAEPVCKFAFREGCGEEAEPLCSDAQLDSTRCRTDQAEHVLSQAEQIMGLENGPGKTKKSIHHEQIGCEGAERGEVDCEGASRTSVQLRSK